MPNPKINRVKNEYPLAALSETLRPLPRPPLSELENQVTTHTINHYSHLFNVSTPINVNRFEQLLQTHPNQPLVQSVCEGLRFGFWPFAEPDMEVFPSTLEVSNGVLSNDEEHYIREYIEEEVKAGRYSESFGPDLLPGMYAMPVYTIPKPHSTKLRLINNHSAGPFSLNDMIDKEKVGMRPDNVQDLGRNLLRFRQLHGSVPLWLYKSDIAKAYRHLPMHPLWQIKQAVKLGNTCWLDRCCCFGSRGSPDLWCTFVALLVWIALHIFHIPLLLVYMDDHFSFDSSSSLERYSPYNTAYPPNQVRLLRFWDELGIQHEKSKQIFGHTLTIIGFQVDSDRMSISLPPENLADLLAHIRAFATISSRRQPLREWQRLLGWINWALNVQPLLCPAIQSAYSKIRFHKRAFALVYINCRVRNDLLWLADVLERSRGIFILQSTVWSVAEADLTVFCDACLSGMAFWLPQLCKGFVAQTTPSSLFVDDTIFWFEALTVLSALEWIASSSLHVKRVVIFTDNLNTVQMFDSFHSHPPYDLILLRAISLLYNSPTNRKRPLTIDDILHLITAYPLHCHDNKLFMAIVICGFFALHRLGELTISDDHRLQESRKIITRSSTHCSTNTFGYTLPSHKADRIFEGSTILISSAHEDVNPQPFFQAYLQSRDHRFPFHPQLFLTSTGSSPTRNWFLTRLHTHIFDNVAGHSLRAGGATYFASIGWPDDRIQSLGRWKSNNFHIYIRKNPVVLQALLHARQTPNPPNPLSTPRV